MSKNEQAPLLRVELLFAQRHDTRPSRRAAPGATLNRGQQHAHPFWQIDVVHCDSVLQMGRRVIELAAGSIVIIPPNQQHRFDYPHGRDFLSMKLAVHGALSGQFTIIPMVDEYRMLYQQIDRFFAADCRPQHSHEQIINHLLAALFHLAYDDTFEDHQSMDPVLQMVYTRIVERSGVGLRVSDLAREAACSDSYLARRFKEEFGMSIKAHIQQQRAQRACELLTYADSSISEIADVLGFADVFSFSKFFKQQYGQTPSLYRAAHGSV